MKLICSACNFATSELPAHAPIAGWRAYRLQEVDIRDTHVLSDRHYLLCPACDLRLGGHLPAHAPIAGW